MGDLIPPLLVPHYAKSDQSLLQVSQKKTIRPMSITYDVIQVYMGCITETKE
jgi:hypothetical protein